MVDETILRRLVYVKKLYNSSQDQFRKYSDVDIARSIVTLDNCVEAFLWIVLENKIPEKVNSLRDKPFIEILRKSQEFLKLDEPYLLELHRVRNNIQHNGFIVAKTQANRYFPIAINLFKSECPKLFNIQWGDVTLSALVNEEDIRSLLSQAELCISNNNFVKAAELLIMAFETAKRFTQISQVGSMITLDRHMAESSYETNEIYKYAEKIEQEVEVLKLGLDYHKWLMYRRPLGNVNPFEILYDIDDDTFQNKEKMYLFTEERNELKRWVDLNMMFVIESILMWQQRFLEMADEPS